MEWLLEMLGRLVDRILGERTTVEYNGPVAHRQVTLRPSLAEADVAIGVKISQYTYVTKYDRWWVPNSKQSVFRVLAFAPESIRETLDPRLFKPMFYPLLCNSLLKRSKYPHMYALHAFLDRMGPFYPTIKIEL